MASARDAGVADPVDAAAVVLEAGVLRDLRNLELLVFGGELDGDAVEHVEEPGLVDALGILAHVVLVVGHDVALDAEDALERAVLEIARDDRRHAAEDAVVQKEPRQGGRLDGAEGLARDDTAEHVLDEVRLVSARPEELLEVHRLHRQLGLVADADMGYPFVVNA